MKYHLLFALKLRQEESGVIYNSEGFIDRPVPISIPEITNIIRDFVNDFNEVAIVEPKTLKKPALKKASSSNENDSETAKKNEHSKNGIEQNTNLLRGVAGKAYICQLKELNKCSLDRLCFEIATYLKKCLSEISPDQILSSKLASNFAGIREAIELRNYLSSFVEEPSDMYQNGYICIIPMN